MTAEKEFIIMEKYGIICLGVVRQFGVVNIAGEKPAR